LGHRGNHLGGIIERIGKGGKFVGVNGVEISSIEGGVGKAGGVGKEIKVILGVVDGMVRAPLNNKVAILEEGLTVVKGEGFDPTISSLIFLEGSFFLCAFSKQSYVPHNLFLR
jgi:hypothetical protein